MNLDKKIKARAIICFSVLLTMLVAAMLSACAADDGTEALSAAGGLGKTDKLTIALEGYDGSIDLQNLKAALSIRQQGANDALHTQAGEAEESGEEQPELSLEAKKAMEREAFSAGCVIDADAESHAEATDEIGADEETAAEVNEGAELQAKSGDEGIIEDMPEGEEAPAPVTFESVPATAAVPAAGTVSGKELIADTPETEKNSEPSPIVNNAASEGLVYGTVWNSEAALGPNGALLLSFDIDPDIYPINLDELNIYDVSVSTEVPCLTVSLQTAAQDSQAAVNLHWGKLVEDGKAAAEAEREETANAAQNILAGKVCTTNHNFIIKNFSEKTKPYSVIFTYHTVQNPIHVTEKIDSITLNTSSQRLSFPLNIKSGGSSDTVYVDTINLLYSKSSNNKTFCKGAVLPISYKNPALSFSSFTKGAFAIHPTLIVSNCSGKISSCKITYYVKYYLNGGKTREKTVTVTPVYDASSKTAYCNFTALAKDRLDDVYITKIEANNAVYTGSLSYWYASSRNPTVKFSAFKSNNGSNNNGSGDSSVKATVYLTNLASAPKNSSCIITYYTNKNYTSRTKIVAGTYDSVNKRLAVQVDLGAENVKGSNWMYINKVQVDNITWSGNDYLYYQWYGSNKLSVSIAMPKAAPTPAPTPTPTQTSTPAQTPTPTPTPASTVKYQITVSSVPVGSGSSTLSYQENGTGAVKTAYGSYNSSYRQTVFTVNTKAASIKVTKAVIGDKSMETAKTVYSSNPNLTLYYSGFSKNIILYVKNVPGYLSGSVQFTEGSGSAVKTLSTGSYTSYDKQYRFTDISTTADYITVKKITLGDRSATAETKVSGTSYTFDYNSMTCPKTVYRITVNNVPQKPSFAQVTYKLNSSGSYLTEGFQGVYDSAKKQVVFTLNSEAANIYVYKVEADNSYRYPYQTVYRSNPESMSLDYASMPKSYMYFTVNITGVNSYPYNKVLYYRDGGNYDKNCYGYYNSSSKTVNFSISSKEPVTVNKISVQQERNGSSSLYTKEIALNYAAQTASVDYSSFAQEKPYAISVTDVAQKPANAVLTYSQGASAETKSINTAAYSGANKTLTFTVNSDQSYINVKSIRLDNASCSVSARVNGSSPNYSVSFSRFELDKIAYSLKITGLSKSSSNNVLTYKSTTSDGVKSVNGTYSYPAVTFNFEDTGSVSFESVSLDGAEYTFKQNVSLNSASRNATVNMSNLEEEACYKIKVTGVNSAPTIIQFSYKKDLNEFVTNLSGQYDSVNKCCIFKVNSKDTNLIYVNSFKIVIEDEPYQLYLSNQPLEKSSPNLTINLSRFTIKYDQKNYNIIVTDVPSDSNDSVKATLEGSGVNNNGKGIFQPTEKTVTWKVTGTKNKKDILTCRNLTIYINGNIKACFARDIVLTPDISTVTIHYNELDLYKWQSGSTTSVCDRCDGMLYVTCTNPMHENWISYASPVSAGGQNMGHTLNNAKCSICGNRYATYKKTYTCPKCNGTGEQRDNTSDWVSVK